MLKNGQQFAKLNIGEVNKDMDFSSLFVVIKGVDERKEFKTNIYISTSRTLSNISKKSFERIDEHLEACNYIYKTLNDGEIHEETARLLVIERICVINEILFHREGNILITDFGWFCKNFQYVYTGFQKLKAILEDDSIEKDKIFPPLLEEEYVTIPPVVLNREIAFPITIYAEKSGDEISAVYMRQATRLAHFWVNPKKYIKDLQIVHKLLLKGVNGKESKTVLRYFKRGDCVIEVEAKLDKRKDFILLYFGGSEKLAIKADESSVNDFISDLQFLIENAKETANVN